MLDLFDRVERTDSSPKRETENDFVFLNRSARDEIETVRRTLTSFVARYPPSEVRELLERIRSGDDKHFRSACFELVLHEYLHRLGFEVQGHPPLSNGSAKRPDFLVRTVDGQEVYVEAICTADRTWQDSAAEARKSVALQVLDEHFHPRFMVSINSDGDPDTQPSGRRLAHEVMTWLKNFDPNELTTRIATQGWDSVPELNWAHEGWHVRVQPIPLHSERTEGRMIGVRGGGGGWVDGWSPIKDAVQHKSGRYGELDRPLVVAVNVNTFKLDPLDEVQALFGQEQYVFDRNGGTEARLVRAPNGAWRGPKGPRGTRGSGAWVFGNLSPYTVQKSRHMLYVNPDARHTLPTSFLQMPHMVVRDGFLRERGGVSLPAALDLGVNWPE